MIRAAAILTVLALAPPIGGAPTPAPPPLSSALLVGTWRLEWGSSEGEALFRPDGTYETIGRDGSFHDVGRWWVDRGHLILWERSRSSGPLVQIRKYEVRLRTGGPVLSGGVYEYESGRYTGPPVTLTPKGD